MPGNNTIFRIDNKVFKKDDFNNLVELLKKLYIRRRDNGSHYPTQALSVKIMANDGIGNDFHETDIESAKLIFRSKKITSLSATYYDRMDNKTLQVTLEDGKYGRNFISLSSDKKSWFDSKRTEIQDYINSVPDQQNYYLNHKKVIQRIAKFILGIPFTITTYLGIGFYYSVFPLETANRSLTTSAHVVTWIMIISFTLVINYLLGSMFTDKLFKIIDSLWPSIEFNFGPNHLNKTAQKRKIVFNLVTIVLVPVLISLIFLYAGTLI